MKKKFFSILAVMLMTLTANAEKTITWDYNTFKSITFDAQSYYPNYSGEYPLISKDGITMYVPVDYWGRFYFINCNMGSNSSHYDYEWIYFYSTVGRITSINIKCNDGSQTRIEDADFYQWTINQTSVSWTGSIPRCEVSMPLRANYGIQGIQQISFTIDEEKIYNILNPKDGDVLNGTTISIDYDIAPPYTYDDFNPTYEAKEGTTIIYKPINEKQTNRGYIAYNNRLDKTLILTNNGDGTWTLPMPAYDVYLSRRLLISSIPNGWMINGEKTYGYYNLAIGGVEYIFTPVNIPTGKKIKSIKVVDENMEKTPSFLTDNGDGTWTLSEMPYYDIWMIVDYEDSGNIPNPTYTISNIPDGWKVNGSTTNGTYEAAEGAEVIFTPANIPAGKKIKSIKAVKK